MKLKIFNQIIFHNNVEKDCCNIESDKEAVGMRAMWRAVITQALMDAASESKKVNCLAIKLRARAWLKGESDDFVKICSLAEMDPEYVKFQAKIAISNKCKWRRSPNNL